jgi:penicillin-binding protein 2
MRMLPITPIRGKIFDGNGKMIAGNQLAYKLTLTPEKTKNVSETLSHNC